MNDEEFDEFEVEDFEDATSGCGEARVSHEHADETELPATRFSWGLLLGEWLDNTGDILEHFAEYPKALTRRLFAHHTHERGKRLSREEAARTIEQIESFANENRSDSA